jgi:IS5 family transposase
VVNEITRVVIETARREKRFWPRVVRIDSTVVEADVRYPTDSGLALDSARVLAGEARKLVAKVGKDAGRVRDRSRAIGRRVRAMTRTLGRRTGERKQQVLEFTEQAGRLVERSIREAERLIVVARRRARGRGANAKLRQINKLQTFIERAERVTEQIRKRMRGEPITDRMVSIFDPDARPIRKGKLGKPNEFGYVAQICEVTENTKTGARGLIIPAASGELGNPTEDTLLPDTAVELQRLGISPREVALDGGFNVGPVREALEGFDPERTFIAGRQQPGSRRTQRRLARYRTGSEGRISHLKRGYGLRRSRLKDHQGMQTWTAWSILTYNLDTLAIRAT